MGARAARYEKFTAKLPVLLTHKGLENTPLGVINDIINDSVYNNHYLPLNRC